MKLEEIPDALLNKIKAQFDKEDKVVKWRVTQRMYAMKGNLMAVKEIGDMLDDLFAQTVLNYMEQAEKEVEKIDLEKLDINDEDKDRIAMLGLVMFIASDLIESAIIDVNDSLHKYRKDLDFVMFNDFREMKEMAREKLEFLQKNSGYMKDLVWADKCDDMYKMIQNKAASIMRKRKENPDNWGKNAERLEKR